MDIGEAWLSFAEADEEEGLSAWLPNLQASAENQAVYALALRKASSPAHCLLSCTLSFCAKLLSLTWGGTQLPAKPQSRASIQ